MANLYFTDFFSVSETSLEEHGAFNISLITDLPLFIDPFLLFNSEKKEYQLLHDEIISYLGFLKDKAGATLDPALLKSWFYFSEVKQTWLGFCESGNSGRGLGPEFARALNDSLHTFFKNFGAERITKGSHLEKLCLIKEGVGRDTISDFTTNLIKKYLLEYTQNYAVHNIEPGLRKKVSVPKVTFNYKTETWMSGTYDLPRFKNSYVLLTPEDILTRDDTWINKDELFNKFERVPLAIENDELRALVNNYFASVLPKKPSNKDYQSAARSTIVKYPDAIDYYIKYKEDNGDTAVRKSKVKVENSFELYVEQFGELVRHLERQTNFYETNETSKSETLKRINYLKDAIENKGCHKYFYFKNKPMQRESDLHILFNLTWYDTSFDVSREVNDGRGPADFKVSKGLD
ncbi:MAG: hypothetical protein ACYC5G_05635, partial [Candidatus Doudnabacteria bacterium]